MTELAASGVLNKAFMVLGTFGPTRRTLSLSEIARRSGLPKTTTHRVLHQMLTVGAIERVGQEYRIGTRMFALSSPSREAAVREVAQPHLHDLSRRFGNTLHLATLCDTDVMYIEKLQSRATASSPSAVGTRLPAHCTAVGKVLLAYQPPSQLQRVLSEPLSARTSASIASPDRLRGVLAKVRDLGFATDNEEAAIGLRCVAVPIKVSGCAVAAVSIAHSATIRLSNDQLPALLATAAAIGRGLTRMPGSVRILQMG